MSLLNISGETSGGKVALPTALGTVVHKFGGSSVADASRIRHVARLLQERNDAEQIVVVSALKGVTDELVHLAHYAASDPQRSADLFNALRARHLRCAQELSSGKPDDLLQWVASRFDELEELLGALRVLRTVPSEVAELLQGLGEVYAAHLMAYALTSAEKPCAVLDARDVLVVEHGPLGASVDWSKSSENLESWRRVHSAPRVVVTGFVARNAEGKPTTLGRNGSDYSGSIFAALYEAEELHIWTDVDGVLSADPRLVPEAVPLDSLSYNEACELAYFGAKVVHPQTMTPAMRRGIPIYIRNTFRPEHAGTLISSEASSEPRAVRGLSFSSGLAIVNLEGNGMIGVPGTAERLFAALHRANVSVVMISQGSSEHSICCVICEGDVEKAERAIEEAFLRELASGELQNVQISRAISVLAAVGDGMAGKPGVAAQLFETLARARVNIRAIAQGSSERNISVAVSSDDAAKALRAAHSGFWLSPQTLSIGVIGPGRVGSAFLEQLKSASARLRSTRNLDLRLRAVISSRSMRLSDRGIEEWRGGDDGVCAIDWDSFASHVQPSHLPHAVIVDCSASDEVASHYEEWLRAGIHVITPNKHAGSGPADRYRAIRAAVDSGAARFRYEATVGAGLPIIQTLRDLLDTGDELHAVDGVLSGTIAWLFNRYDGSIPFSELVREAHRLGYTEPDPRDDLSGADVARKLVILAREAGEEIEFDDVVIESLVPSSLRGVSREKLFDRLVELDAPMRERYERAREAGCVLRYVAQLSSEGARVVLAELPRTHAFANLRSTDNIVQFTTRRYCDNPLVVQGPGAGPEVTAAGVFADLLRVAASLGANV